MTLNPAKLGTIGLSYAQGNATTAFQRDAVGLDGKLKAGPAVVNGAFVLSYPTQTATNTDFNQADKAAFINFGVQDYNGLTLNANYRYIDPAFEDGIASMSSNDARYYSGVGGTVNSSAPFGPNENGFGANASYGLGPVKLGAYINSFKSARTDDELKQHPPYSGYANKYDNIGDQRQTSWGVNLGTTTYRGINLTAFFNNAELGDEKISRLYGNNSSEGNFDKFDYADPILKHSSSFGASLVHDGKVKDALVRNLDLKLFYARYYDDNARIKDYRYDDIQATAAYNGKFGVLSFTPFVRFHSFHNPEATQPFINDKANTSSIAKIDKLTAEAPSYTTVKGGLQVKTDALDIVTKPSLFGGFSIRNTKFDTKNEATTEVFGYVGTTFNEFLLPESKFSVGYSFYEGHQLGDVSYSPAIGVDSSAFLITSDKIFRGPGTTPPWITGLGNINVKLSGVYGQWEGWNLKVGYGLFDYTNLNSNKHSRAQAFKIATKLNF